MKTITKKIQDLVDEYKKDPNCYPALWIKGEGLNEVEQKLFVELALNFFNMKTRVIIEDVVAKTEGKSEKELPVGTVIRFEIGNTRLSCKVTTKGLYIIKVNDMYNEEGSIMTKAVTGNVLYVY